MYKNHIILSISFKGLDSNKTYIADYPLLKLCDNKKWGTVFYLFVPPSKNFLDFQKNRLIVPPQKKIYKIP